VFGLIGDSMIRGYPVHFILTLKEDKPLFCSMFSKGYERLIEKLAESQS